MPNTQKGCRIAKLEKFENYLKGKLHIEQLERVKDGAEAERANISDKQYVHSLVLRWNEARAGETNDENVLELRTPTSPEIEVAGDSWI